MRSASLPSGTAVAAPVAAPVRSYGDKFKKSMTPAAGVPSTVAPTPVSISSFTEFPSLRKTATVAVTVAAIAATATATATVGGATSWAKTAKVAHEKDLARIEKERAVEAERLAEEEKERIRNTIHRLGVHSLGVPRRPETRREDEWDEEEGKEPYEDEEDMGYSPANYSGGGYVANKYTEGGYVTNKYTDSGTPPYSPFDQNEVSQGIVEND